MIGFPELVLFGALFVVPVACLTNWIASFKELQSGRPLIAYRNRDTVPWGLLDLGVFVVVIAVLTSVGVAITTSIAGVEVATELVDMTPKQQSAVFLGFGSASLIATLLCFAWTWLRYGKLFGFDVKALGPDVELGLRWFMMLVLPVVLIQLFLTQWFPTKHPLIEMLRESKDLSFLPVAAFAAVITAPIFEEAFFRMYLQGWMEKLQTTSQRTRLGLSTKADRDSVLLGGESSASLDEGRAVSVLQPNPYQSSELTAGAVEEGHQSERNTDSGPRAVMWVPIVVSSGLFALAHFSHGPDWVPLFFLALGLGYLYQRTGRIQACIVVHMLVNALGILQLWAAIRQP